MHVHYSLILIILYKLLYFYYKIAFMLNHLAIDVMNEIPQFNIPHHAILVRLVNNHNIFSETLF